MSFMKTMLLIFLFLFEAWVIYKRKLNITGIFLSDRGK